MFGSKFGIEIEMTGITRERAAKVVADHFGSAAPSVAGFHLGERTVRDAKGRAWKVVSDSSIVAKKKEGGRLVSAGSEYQVELVSPPLSFFQPGGNRTVELRAFGSPRLHAGEIRAYICLALALNHQALTQACASDRRTQTENPKFAMRTYLNRIGLVGEEFKSCREHLTKHLSGNAAWRYRLTA